MKVIHIDNDPNDDWAQVELYRWQHGHLPGEKNKPVQPLDEPAALEAMAEALSQPNQTKWPAPFNVASVLRYAAKRLRTMP